MLDLVPSIGEVFSPASVQNLMSHKHWDEFTLFLPNERAIAQWKFNAMIGGKIPTRDFLLQLLHYHILPVKVESENLASLQFVNTSMNVSDYVNRGPQGRQVLGITKESWGRIKLHTSVKWWPKYSSMVVQRDIPCTDGIIHLIDRVLEMPSPLSMILEETWRTPTKSALISAGLLSTLDSTANITFFIPNNGAIEAFLASGTASPEQMRRMLLDHACNCFVTSLDLFDGMELQMMSGNTAVVAKQGDAWTIGGAVLMGPDGLTRNGVAHMVKGLVIGSQPHLDCSLYPPIQSFECLDEHATAL